MEFQLRFTVSEHGFVPENGERFMEAFMSVYPDGGPSVSQNLKDGTLSVTFALEAEDANEAFSRGIEVFNRGAEASGLEPIEILDFEGSVVPADELEGSPELQPA